MTIPSGLRRRLARLYRVLRECDRVEYANEVRRRYEVHPTARWGYRTELYGDGRIAIGERTYLGNSCYLSAHPAGTFIEIGRGCAIAHNVHFRTTNFARTPHLRDAFDAPPESGSIRVGDWCWIGNHVYIGPGVTIGENCIVGANSVVTHDVPANSVVGGVPARLIASKADWATRKG